MRIVVASDTHTKHAALTVPAGDVFVHCGDFSGKGTLDDVRRFGEWLRTLPHARKVVVAGNHDFAMQRVPDVARELLGDVDYLFDSGVTIDGVRFYGSPWQPIFRNWAFNLAPSDLRAKWSLIPDDTDVLVTHGPPRTILDRNFQGVVCGDPDLYDRVCCVRPALHVFGHIHECSGSLERDETLFVNAAILDSRYRLASRCRIIEVERANSGHLVAVEID